MTRESCDIAVVGGGIVGIAVAAFLAEAGRDVTLVDRTGICEETSSGNAAALAFSDVLPLAQKGMMRNLPRWLTDPLGPLAIPPSYFPKLLPWLFRFWRAGARSKYDASLAAQVSLMQLAEQEWLDLMDRSGTKQMLRQDGSIELYESESEFEASLSGWAAREKFGIEFRHVDQGALAQLQPGLSAQFIKGTFVPGWKTVSNPQLLGKALWNYAQTRGARFLHANVLDVAAASTGSVVQLDGGRTISAQNVVIAAGAWSHKLARRFGDVVPLETERGYNTTFPAASFDLRRQLIFSGHGFVVTPLEGQVRVGGAVELGGLELAPNYARAKAMVQKVKSFLPGFDASNGREWMGYRPSLPDSLPVIGAASSNAAIFYAFGHGHLGLTQAAATGRLIRDIIVGQNPAIDLRPFSVERF
ncbi:MAG: FAD-binding oxidoreductase [Rhizobiaceae bacterium]|nr:FAD-binding oxidoreductase [Rhizobiaceae bacterium]